MKVACARLNHPYIATAYRADRRRRVGGLRLGHRAVLRHPVRGRVRRAAAVAGRRAAAEGQAEARAACARAWCGCARERTWSSTTRCSRAEDYQRIPHYGHSRPADAIEVCRRGRRVSAGAVSPRARAHRRRDRRDPRRHARRVAAQDGATSWTSSPPTRGWTSRSWGSADGARRSGACAARSRRRGRRRCATAATPPACRCARDRRRPHHPRLRHRRAQPRHQPDGRAVRQGRAARRASCSRTPTGITSRASRSSCRSTSRATASTSTAAPRARRCWRGSSRGRWRPSTSRCRR